MELEHLDEPQQREEAGRGREPSTTRAIESLLTQSSMVIARTMTNHACGTESNEVKP